MTLPLLVYEEALLLITSTHHLLIAFNTLLKDITNNHVDNKAHIPLDEFA